MSVYVIITNYLDNCLFGTYSTILRAREVLEKFFAEEENIVSCEDIGDYTYQITDKRGERYYAEILYDVVDAEYEANIMN